MSCSGQIRGSRGIVCGVNNCWRWGNNIWVYLASPDSVDAIITHQSFIYCDKDLGLDVENLSTLVHRDLGTLDRCVARVGGLEDFLELF